MLLPISSENKSPSFVGQVLQATVMKQLEIAESLEEVIRANLRVIWTASLSFSLSSKLDRYHCIVGLTILLVYAETKILCIIRKLQLLNLRCYRGIENWGYMSQRKCIKIRLVRWRPCILIFTFLAQRMMTMDSKKKFPPFSYSLVIEKACPFFMFKEKNVRMDGNG